MDSRRRCLDAGKRILIDGDPGLAPPPLCKQAFSVVCFWCVLGYAVGMPYVCVWICCSYVFGILLVCCSYVFGYDVRMCLVCFRYVARMCLRVFCNPGNDTRKTPDKQYVIYIYIYI